MRQGRGRLKATRKKMDLVNGTWKYTGIDRFKRDVVVLREWGVGGVKESMKIFRNWV